ncbi:MAG: CDP-glycerol glycerophosphotransferase family protein [Candidatus Thorarchaeota archaeon]
MVFRTNLARLFKIITQGLDYIWPKDPRILIFGSSMGLFPSGNAKALFNYITGNPDSPFHCHFFLRDCGPDSRYRRYTPFNLKTYLLFLKAKTVLITHGLYDIGRLNVCSKKKNIIKLWHGRPGLKGDGYSSKSSTREQLAELEREDRKTTAFLVCSRMESFMRAYSNVLHPRQILPLGYPKNDILLKDAPPPTTLRDIFPTLPDFEQALLYAPTWRDYAQTKFFPFDDFDAEALESWLEKRNAILLLRAHISDSIPVSESKRIRSLSFEDCNEITDILKEINVIITDYSSITADFLLLDRPIIYIPYDRNQFESRIGFCYGNFDFWTPGEKVYSFADFIQAANVALEGDDGYSEQRKLVNQFVNEFQSHNSTERVYTYLKRKLGYS